MQTVSLPWTDYIQSEPTLRQMLFLSCPQREVLYGGAAGGGKSEALLMAALQYVDQPGYAAIIFRRTYADLALPGALMDRADEWLSGTDATWHGQERRWQFPSGATLSFGYLDGRNDRYRYQSAEFQFVGFDELTQFREQDYRYLFSRLRRLEGSQVPVRMRAGTNPGGIGHDWVKRRFIDAGNSPTRVFIPALLDDNPYLDRAEYVETLAELDPVTKQQLLRGDWSARVAGNMFRREWFTYIDASEVPADCAWCRFWDFAGTEDKGTEDQAYTAGVLIGRDRDGIFYLRDVKRDRLEPPGVERLVLATAHSDRAEFGNVAVRIEQEPGSSGKFVVRQFATKLAAFDFRGRPATGSKVERAKPFSGAAGNGLVRIVNGPWTEAFIDEAEAFPEGVTRDQVDAASGGYSELAGGQSWEPKSYQG